MMISSALCLASLSAPFTMFVVLFTAAFRVLFNTDNWYEIKFHGCFTNINFNSFHCHADRHSPRAEQC